MRFELFKIIRNDYLDDMLDGNLYMNTLDYFRSVEDNVAQGDPLEGVCGTVRKDQLRQFGMYFDDEMLDSVGEHVALISDKYGFNNVYCLYCFLIDDDEKCIWKPDERLFDFGAEDPDRLSVVHIRNTEEFLRRVDAALEAELSSGTVEYGIYGQVEYSSAWLSADGPGKRSVFHKNPSYAYQMEWRLCVLRNAWDDRPWSLRTGDLRDITEILPPESFIHRPESIYQGYRVVEGSAGSDCGSYRILGRGNAVNHLMYSYMPQLPEPVTLSDRAKADWHYTQYLSLTDRRGEIDQYLTGCLEKYRDIEHMELLVKYRLSTGDWVKATDAFYFMLENSQEEIQKDTGRFFFPLHTILMQHREAADAGKLLKIASDRYGLPEDLELVMRSDCMFALGFYDKAYEIFSEMRRSSDDPILEYNLAVSQLHLLNFEHAEEHIKNFLGYFSSNEEFAHMAARIQGLIDCFLHHKPLELKTAEHALSGLEWDDKTEKAFAELNGRSMYLGIDALYRIEKADKWGLVSGARSAEICTLTVSRIIELYKQTGDLLLYSLIGHIAEAPNVKIISPELDYYLAINMKEPNLPPHYKMERALMAQDSRSS